MYSKENKTEEGNPTLLCDLGTLYGLSLLGSLGRATEQAIEQQSDTSY